MKHEKNLIWFDLLRGIAAILVLIGHLRALIFLPFSGKNTTFFEKLFFFITGFGHEAVVIFFVLSGFFITRSIHEAVVKKKWLVKNYSINRLTRLWIVLLPALLLTLIWDTIGLTYFADSTAYTGTTANMPDINPSERLGWITFIGNVFFLQNIHVDTFGSNPALWSLANEFWYYLIFPLCYFAINPYYKPTIRILIGLTALCCTYFIGEGIALSFLIWLMGGGTYFLILSVQSDVKHSLIVRGVLILIFIIILTCIRVGMVPLIFNEFSLGVITALLLFSLAFAEIKSSFIQKISSFLSNISYTVYLTHLSFAVFLTSAFQTQGLLWSMTNFSHYVILLTIIIGYCFFMYWLFERNTFRVKEIILKHV